MAKMYVNTYYGVGGKTLQELGNNICKHPEVSSEGQNKVVAIVKQGGNCHKIVIASKWGAIRTYTAQTIRY